MVIKDTIRVKSDGKGTIRLTIMRDGKSISTTLLYSFDDDKPAVSCPETEARDKEESEVAEDGK